MDLPFLLAMPVIHHQASYASTLGVIANECSSRSDRLETTGPVPERVAVSGGGGRFPAADPGGGC